MTLDAFFSDTYETARSRFRAAAAKRGARLEALTLDATGPGGRDLTIDLAHVGHASPRHVLVHVSGVHGVEGFTGSAIQLAALERLPTLAPDAAVVFVHALNPFGMAWLRRFNEHNVDLNRNFNEHAADWSGAPTLYRELDGFLNPRHIGRIDTFYLEVARQIARHGLGALRNAIAGGQYDYPEGLFFGGHDLEQGPALYKAWLTRHLSSAQRVFVIDVHTGLGKWAQNSLFHTRHSRADRALPVEMARHIVPDYEDRHYAFRGAHADVYAQTLDKAEIDCLAQEFGTLPGVRVLKALRAENHWHHHGRADVTHRSKSALRDAFCPRSVPWRRSVLTDGVRLFESAVAYVFDSGTGT